jgi:hypothetical protein
MLLNESRHLSLFNISGKEEFLDVGTFFLRFKRTQIKKKADDGTFSCIHDRSKTL